MSGFELLPAMRSIDGLDQLPAIFLSGRVEHGRRRGRARDGRDLPDQALQRERAHPHDPEARAGRDRLVTQAARAAKYAPPPSARS
jgi:hypothetical protein